MPLLGSVWRLPGLPVGRNVTVLAGAAVQVAVAAVLVEVAVGTVRLVWARPHQRGTGTAQPPARFTLRGAWWQRAAPVRRSSMKSEVLPGVIRAV